MSHSLHLSKDIMSSLFSLQQSKLHALNTITSRRWPQFSTIRALVSIPNLICCVKSLSIQTHPVLSMRPWPWPYCSSTELRLAFCLGNARDKEFFKWGRLPEMLTRCQTQDNMNCVSEFTKSKVSLFFQCMAIWKSLAGKVKQAYGEQPGIRGQNC